MHYYTVIHSHILHFLFSSLLRKQPFFKSNPRNQKPSEVSLASSSSRIAVSNEQSVDFIHKLKIMSIPKEKLTVMLEDIFDIFGLKENGIHLLNIIDSHQWHHYNNMLNGLTYSELVKYFWVRAEVIDNRAPDEELRRARAHDPRNANKSRKELGKKDFFKAKIRSFALEALLVVTKGLISKLIKVDEFGAYYRDANNKTMKVRKTQEGGLNCVSFFFFLI